MYKVGVIGWGVVGQGVGNLLEEYLEAIYDPYAKVPKPSKKSDFKDLDMVVISVPTPTSKDGISCDTSIVENTLSWLSKLNFKGVVMIKSTTAPSKLLEFKSKYKLRLVFSPEYMGESRYFTPFWKYPDPTRMEMHTWQTFGGDKKDTELCIEIFKRKMSVDTHFYQTDLVTAALAKYIENCFFATKVTFVNEWYDIAQKFGADWNELRELWLADPRINKNHTLVFKRDRGYGGKCFPKDVKALIKDADNMGYSADLLKSVDKVNDKIRQRKNADSSN